MIFPGAVHSFSDCMWGETFNHFLGNCQTLIYSWRFGVPGICSWCSSVLWGTFCWQPQYPSFSRVWMYGFTTGVKAVCWGLLEGGIPSLFLLSIWLLLGSMLLSPATLFGRSIFQLAIPNCSGSIWRHSCFHLVPSSWSLYC